MFYPDKKEFIKLAKQGNLIPVYKEIVADTETPVSAYKKIEGEYSFLLESIEGGEKIARYSFLGTCEKKNVCEFKALKDIREYLLKFKPVKIKDLPRFHGGLVGYISYDKVREIEVIPDKNPDELKVPELLLLFADTVLAFDHVKKKIMIVSNALIDGDAEKAYQQACSKIAELEEKLRQPVVLKQLKTTTDKKLELASNFTPKQYEEVVEKTKQYIRSGDIIQAVLSQRITAPCDADPFDVYRVLRMINPSPYMYYFKLGELNIAGSSPEVMVRLEGKTATVRPIAGTRRRGHDEADDQKMEAELLASDKERAEHIMLVDLGRNDLGRVCKFGTVKVTEEMIVEKYSHVMHIVSNVEGQLNNNQDAVDLLAATFPAGTVSGAPKIRAMEIIDELETTRRGPYAGCVGYFGFYGELDTCITIRTILFKDKHAYIQAGAGIVADSKPAEEYKETLNKAKAMLKAIELVSD
ncbi:anthranilate synthase component I [candidate division WOR-1 bacterium RIFOXYB2_FULL_42_35]|uniref:Anthranilate synthase component 1 n=1 Tax=candidate division WOR-1 bacterium RIFOXYC2_FULL_41_25 TaxID=1802586 RepID=A0A1F4TN83_UNCSA|nr:MAG: anthranilate synthase component I [candidate division WOR-1 bacterium RIFOXYA2_FULL_41_14]OGC23151.1 MAG: anthranilate synthase component I [candidate division WOR-1 bacterium RIFOXYB2_FULL_42_35]OGC34067.1 MAG: anthranilate synthase component I [candidate division WOR-1 bacterium RIFOXYC2_FULL_41_25]